jgi:hypothetical protein
MIWCRDEYTIAILTIRLSINVEVQAFELRVFVEKSNNEFKHIRTHLSFIVVKSTI